MMTPTNINTNPCNRRHFLFNLENQSPQANFDQSSSYQHAEPVCPVGGSMLYSNAPTHFMGNPPASWNDPQLPYQTDPKCYLMYDNAKNYVYPIQRLAYSNASTHFMGNPPASSNPWNMHMNDVNPIHTRPKGKLCSLTTGHCVTCTLDPLALNHGDYTLFSCSNIQHFSYIPY